MHAWPLLAQHELTAGEVLAGLGKKDGDLDRKSEIAVQILVKAIEMK